VVPAAFREGRYRTMAIEADEHLHRWLVYIALNMVRATNTKPRSTASRR
jgi:hypothetical protein